MRDTEDDEIAVQRNRVELTKGIGPGKKLFGLWLVKPLDGEQVCSLRQRMFLCPLY